MTEESPDVLSTKKCIIGNSVGLLSAAAVSSFSSLASFLPVAIEHIRIAFRLGVEVDAVSERISSAVSGKAGWSKIVPGVTEASIHDLLAGFHKDSVRHSRVVCASYTTESITQAVPAPKQAYISSTGPSGVTISGPPETLTALFESTALKDSRPIDNETYGVYNAPHLYGDASVSKIISFSDAESTDAVEKARPRVPVFSTATGSAFAADSCKSLVAQTVTTILRETADCHAVLQECTSRVKGSKCRVVPIGPTLDSELIVSKLQEKDVQIVSLFETALGSVQRRGTGNHRASKIAIVGMSGRFPGGRDIHEFWEMLSKGLDMHKEVSQIPKTMICTSHYLQVPADRFDGQAHYDPSGKGRNMSHTPFGNFIEDAGLFDPRFFNMSPREATQTDPMQRLAIMTAYEALEMSGYVANRTPSTKLERIGTFYGQTSDDWREINEAQDIDTYFITGGVRAFGPVSEMLSNNSP